jgi:hypothetical protein
MPATHKCPRCGTPVPRSRLACRADWFALPASVRTAISETYQRGQTILTASEAYLAALQDALEWFADNPGDADPV